MRRRLMMIVIALVSGLVAALGLPLAVTGAEQTSQEMFIGRADDTGRFADAAEPALTTGRPTARLRADLARYDALYDSPAFVVDADGELVAASRAGIRTDAPGIAQPVLRGLAGRPPQRPHVLWPWDARPYVVVEPVIRDNRVLGAAVTVSPTGAARGEVARRLFYVGAGGLLALLAVVLGVAVPLVRWVLRPVHELDEAAHSVGSGRPVGPVSDRTGPPELRRLAASFNAMADGLASAARAQREFVADASHQLRNPLTALRLRLENAESCTRDPLGREELRFAVEETDRLGDTVDGLLRLARAEALDARPEPVDVSVAVQQRVRAWTAAYEAEATPLSADVPPGVTASCLPGLLDHALNALLDNALKFGGGEPVEVSVRRDGGAAEIVVRDGGEGLPGAELGRAGDRFWRSPRHQNTAGTGLGLAVTHRLVEGSGGSMELTAARPRGLRVLIRLPLSDAESGTSGSPRDAVPADTS
ncbi:HAMP domain-containing sensor histidine kinase [Spongiactinospora sp. TRM90649]|uniref:sensor histidine kinase n=1 Tax=Spongiactinospora sp. TRM90649 TaxID=3031114 RepID=UPI0023F9AD5F|nr:HAMP domain-containing sensor histidine kinase [Spongiactinospora sp. TRM90649]MDF5755847.1 HAMP domain-containing sensor histidine kinase [Spongiactinospora sp. TRM90649]